MNILICNDDGIKSEGILTLAKLISAKHSVYVMAPSVNRSAYGHAISIGKTLKLKEHNGLIENTKVFSLSGTPADCVKFAINMSGIKFDAAVSGINTGPNLGTDILYSGTVSAALEAVSFGLPAIAVSLTSHTDKRFEYAAEFVAKNLEGLAGSCKGEFVWNINVPAKEKDKIQGVKYTKMGYQVYSDVYNKTGRNRYSLSGEPVLHDKNDADCDVEWNLKNYITITPIAFNKTDYQILSAANYICKM